MNTISIRRSLLTNPILVVVLLGFGIVAMMALSTRRAVQELSGSLIRQASHRQRRGPGVPPPSPGRLVVFASALAR